MYFVCIAKKNKVEKWRSEAFLCKNYTYIAQCSTHCSNATRKYESDVEWLYTNSNYKSWHVDRKIS